MAIDIPYSAEIDFTDRLKKPAKGTIVIARRRNRQGITEYERAEKLHVRQRDSHLCRWPRCGCKGLKIRTEVAHIKAKSLGGSNERTNLMLLCVLRHQGERSLHSGDCEILPQDRALGTEGPCDFLERNMQTGEMEIVASERFVGVSESRRPK